MREYTVAACADARDLISATFCYTSTSLPAGLTDVVKIQNVDVTMEVCEESFVRISSSE